MWMPNVDSSLRRFVGLLSLVAGRSLLRATSKFHHLQLRLHQLLEPIHHRLTRLLVTVVLRRSTGRWRRLWCRGGLHGSGGWSFANSLPCLFDGLPVGFLKQIIFEVAALYAHESRHRRCILASERAFTQSHTITGPWTCIAAVYVMAAAFGTMACGHVCHLGSAFVGVVAVQGMAERNSILRVALIAFASARRS